jgi:hypothetical protein
MNTVLTPTELLDHTAANYADARKLLADRVQTCKAEIDAVTRRHLDGIRKAAGLAAQAEAQLRQHIEESPDLFVKPRTMTLHGVKLGYQKGKGRIDYADAAKVCDLIRRHLPDEAGALIVTTETPVKPALLNLDVGTLRKLGCTVTGTEDAIIIKDSAGEVDKIVARLLAEFAQPEDRS